MVWCTIPYPDRKKARKIFSSIFLSHIVNMPLSAPCPTRPCRRILEDFKEKNHSHTTQWKCLSQHLAPRAAAGHIWRGRFTWIWWVLHHCTGLARLVGGRLRVHRAFVYSAYLLGCASVTLQYIATLYNTLQCTTPRCTTLRYTATHCNTLKHTASHYTATRRNTAQAIVRH